MISVLRNRPVLLAAGLMMVLSIGGCTNLLGDSGVSVSRTGEGLGSQAVPAGTDPEDEVIGRREHPRIIASYGGVYSDRQAEVMVARIAGKLLGAANQGNASYTVTILDTPDVNAFALPGGYIYVTRGILALANDESELAAVLAHEIAHVTLKHARARSNRTRTSAIVDKVITGVLGGNVETDQTAARSRLSMAAFSQQQELAADKEGVQIAGRAGYDPHAASRFLAAMGRFADMASAASDNGDDFLSSHPSTPDRIQEALESARTFFGAPGIGDTNRNEYLAAIEGITFGDSPDKGSIVGRSFVHPKLRFTFTVPQGYTLQNSRSAVVGVAGDGEAVRFDSAEVPSSMALTDYLKSGWIAGLQPETVQPANYNGIEMATGQAATNEWVFRVSVARLDGEVYRFIFASKTDTKRFASAAEETLKSFRRATDNDISQIRTTDIELVTARSGDTIRSLAAKMANTGNAFELFLVLNNLYSDDAIVPGQKYKIVGVK